MNSRFYATAYSEYYNNQKAAQERSSAQERVSVRRMLVDMMLLDCTEAQREVVRMRFGLDDHRPHSLGEIGEKLGRSRQSVFQMLKTALKRLRHAHGDGFMANPLGTKRMYRPGQRRGGTSESLVKARAALAEKRRKEKLAEEG